MRYPRLAKWGRRALWTGGVLGGVYVATDLYTDSSLTRSLRSLYCFFRIAYLYKYTTPETAEQYFDLHRQSASMILHVCLKNEGLYIKLGQGLNSLSHVLPKEYTDILRVLLDDAPPVSFDVVRRIIEGEVGKPLEEIFSAFNPTPIAAASIAQVHRARLRPQAGETEGMEVAVKVRKPCVSKQGEWDIRTYSLMSTLVEMLFGLPTAWSRKTIVDGLRRETNFQIEAANALRFREDFKDNKNVYIPKVIEDYTTEKLLVLEWIEGLKVAEVEKIKERYNEKKVLKIIFDSFGDMLFKNGFVHCDPHAANVLVRPLPEASTNESRHPFSFIQSAKQKKSTPQIVFLDFGLSVPVTERFRIQYALLFKSLFTHDFELLKKIGEAWGLGNAETFASMQMQKPVSSLRKGNFEEVTKEEVMEMQRTAHKRMKSFLLDEAKIPKELPLVGRGIDILRGINRLYKSPINRLNMFVQSAVEGLGPIGDYEAAERYLRRIEKKRASSAASSSSTSATPAQEGQEEVIKASKKGGSVFDDQSELERKEQAEVIKEINAERTVTERIQYGLISFYRDFVFHALLWYIHLVYLWTRYSAAVMNWFLPEAYRRNPNALEDKIEERIESNMKLE